MLLTSGATEASLQQCLDGGGWTRQGVSQLPRSQSLPGRWDVILKTLDHQAHASRETLQLIYDVAITNSQITQYERSNMPPERPRASIAGRIKNSRFVDYVWRAFRSAAYPIQGIWYFSKQGKFWPLWAGRLLPLSLVSLTVYLILFLFAYLPQVAFLAIWQGRGAWFSAAILTLGEGLVLIQALFEGFFVDEARVDVFDVSSPSYEETTTGANLIFCVRRLP